MAEQNKSAGAPETMHEKGLPEKKAAVSTQKIIEVEAIKDGVVVLKNKSLRAIIMCSSINFALMSGDEQKAKLFAFQDFLNSLDFPIQIVIQSKKLNVRRYLQKIKEAERLQENELLKMQTASYAEYIMSLVELANITSNHYYVVVPYTNPLHVSSGGIMEKIQSILKPAADTKKSITSFEADKKELALRVQTVLSGLQGVGLRAAVLDTEEAVELFYSVYNPVVSQNQILAEIEKIRLENI